ncbi:hypothetical protein Trco_001704 [Trichoderma cornu-damae]|uniref:Uncharacterized protein n=1 Tax=Trichoderma cornu-damae TaxID=654480 RepID=A0A9P8QSD3_9HYPO|nr:hypothetical protein Trco_001704 [Trichoderma cornu-damae]
MLKARHLETPLGKAIMSPGVQAIMSPVVQRLIPAPMAATLYHYVVRKHLWIHQTPEHRLRLVIRALPMKNKSVLKWSK